jgi:hypothetical protein
MYPPLFLVIFLPFLATAVDDPVPHCYWSGCADTSNCVCVRFFMACDVTTGDPDGTCRFTAGGIVVAILGGLLLLSLLSAILSVLTCFRKTFCCCCKARDTHIHYHGPAPMHEQL